MDAVISRIENSTHLMWTKKELYTKPDQLKGGQHDRSYKLRDLIG